ncbi:MAG TPA: hypothetical protein VJS64_06510 [Pyrinomonadaceae bacterium]|nr:hypothetical protein [Pyrinomonadaceae bacterium]
MNPIEEIKSRLRKYPDVKYESTASSITVLALSDTGFNVGFEGAAGRYTVFFNGWHEEFSDAGEALDCFAFGLSDECRLKEHRRGHFAYRWTVEAKQNGQWVPDSETGLFLFPFWKHSEVVYLQNNLISRDEPLS